MAQENVESIRRGFEMWNVALTDPDEATWRGASRAMTDSYHPDAELDFSRTLPDFPTARARDAMSAWVETTREMFTGVHVEPIDIIDAGDLVVLVMRITGVGTRSGASVEAEFTLCLSLSRAAIIAATTYTTRQEALQAVGMAD